MGNRGCGTIVAVTRPRRLALILALPAAAALMMAGCGSSSPTPTAVASAPAGSAAAEASSPAGDASSQAAASSAPAATSAAAPAPAPAAGGSDAKAFCATVAKQRSTLQGTQLSQLLAGGSPAAWKTYLTAATQMNQQLVDAAPGEIRPSVVVLQQSTKTLATAMEAGDYDPAKVGSAKLIASMRSKDAAKAATTLSAYVKKNCAIDLTKAG